MGDVLRELLRIKMKKIFLFLFFNLWLFSHSPLLANNLTISSVKLKSQDTSANTIVIQFTLSWDNSWRDSANYDAAWIFVKHNAAGTTTWNHVTLSASGTNPSGFSAGTGTALDIIVPSDKKGCFIQRKFLVFIDIQIILKRGKRIVNRRAFIMDKIR